MQFRRYRRAGVGIPYVSWQYVDFYGHTDANSITYGSEASDWKPPSNVPPSCFPEAELQTLFRAWSVGQALARLLQYCQGKSMGNPSSRLIIVKSQVKRFLRAEVSRISCWALNGDSGLKQQVCHKYFVKSAKVFSWVFSFNTVNDIFIET